MLFNTEATDCVEVIVKHTRGILVRKRKLLYMRSFNTGLNSGFLKNCCCQMKPLGIPWKIFSQEHPAELVLKKQSSVFTVISLS